MEHRHCAKHFARLAKELLRRNDHIASLESPMGKTKKSKTSEPGVTLIASNRVAQRNYAIDDTFEAGLVLQGSEVKSMREASVQIADSYARIRDGEAWLEGVHVAPYSFAVGVGSHDPDRSRKLLMHRDEIRKLKARVDQERVSLIPLRLYFRDGRVKVEIAVGKGRTRGDKRQAIAERDSQRDVERELGRLKKGY
jgi:SsrA-binding protein